MDWTQPLPLYSALPGVTDKRGEGAGLPYENTREVHYGRVKSRAGKQLPRLARSAPASHNIMSTAALNGKMVGPTMKFENGSPYISLPRVLSQDDAIFKAQMNQPSKKTRAALLADKSRLILRNRLWDAEKSEPLAIRKLGTKPSKIIVGQRRRPARKRFRGNMVVLSREFDTASIIQQLSSLTTRKQRVSVIRHIASMSQTIRQHELHDIAYFISMVPRPQERYELASSLVAGSLYFTAIRSCTPWQNGQRHHRMISSILSDIRAAIVLSLEPGGIWSWPEVDRTLMMTQFAPLSAVTAYRHVRPKLMELGVEGLEAIGRLERNLVLTILMDMSSGYVDNQVSKDISRSKMNSKVINDSRPTSAATTAVMEAIEAAANDADDTDTAQQRDSKKQKSLAGDSFVGRKESEELKDVRSSSQSRSQTISVSDNSTARTDDDSVGSASLLDDSPDVKVDNSGESQENIAAVGGVEFDAASTTLQPLSTNADGVTENEIDSTDRSVDPIDASLYGSKESTEAYDDTDDATDETSKEVSETPLGEKEESSVVLEVQESHESSEMTVKEPGDIDEYEQLVTTPDEAITKATIVAIEQNVDSSANSVPNAEDGKVHDNETLMLGNKDSTVTVEQVENQPVGDDLPQVNIGESRDEKLRTDLPSAEEIVGPKSDEEQDKHAIEEVEPLLRGHSIEDATENCAFEAAANLDEGSSLGNTDEEEKTNDSESEALQMDNEMSKERAQSISKHVTSAEEIVQISESFADANDDEADDTAGDDALVQARLETEEEAKNSIAVIESDNQKLVESLPVDDKSTINDEGDNRSQRPKSASVTFAVDENDSPQDEAITKEQSNIDIDSEPGNNKNVDSHEKIGDGVEESTSGTDSANLEEIQAIQPEKVDDEKQETEFKAHDEERSEVDKVEISEIDKVESAVQNFRQKLGIEIEEASAKAARMKHELAQIRANKEAERQAARSRVAAKREEDRLRIAKQREEIEKRLAEEERRIEVEKIERIALIEKEKEEYAKMRTESKLKENTDERISSLTAPLIERSAMNVEAIISAKPDIATASVPIPYRIDYDLPSTSSASIAPSHVNVHSPSSNSNKYYEDEQIKIERNIEKMREKLAAERAELQASLAAKRASLEQARKLKAQQEKTTAKLSSGAVSVPPFSTVDDVKNQTYKTYNEASISSILNERPLLEEGSSSLQSGFLINSSHSMRMLQERHTQHQNINPQLSGATSGYSLSAALGGSAMPSSRFDIAAMTKQQRVAAPSVPMAPLSGIVSGPSLHHPAHQGLTPHLTTTETERLADVMEYAVYLGMDPIADKDLFYIAEWAINAPLPEGWTEHLDEENNEFYYNSMTGVSTYEHPLDEQYRAYYRQIKAQRQENKRQK